MALREVGFRAKVKGDKLRCAECESAKKIKGWVHNGEFTCSDCIEENKRYNSENWSYEYDYRDLLGLD